MANYIQELTDALPTGCVVTGASDQTPFLQDWRSNPSGYTPIVVCPKTTAQVSDVIKICAANGVKITTQGGNTGLVYGQIPQGEVLLSLKNMNTISAVSVDNQTITLGAGVILDAAQAHAGEHGYMIPIDLAASGSATIGGMIATNAGGTRVVRHGMMRQQVLGLEVVLANGEIWNGLGALTKDNQGWDFKQAFIGSEGTLGVITAATLRLVPISTHPVTAMFSVQTLDEAVSLFSNINSMFSHNLHAMELIGTQAMSFVLEHVDGVQNPFPDVPTWSILCEVSAHSEAEADMIQARLADIKYVDAVLAQTEAQRQNLWTVRESISAAQKHEGGSWKFDIAVPRSKLSAFVDAALTALQALCPGCRPVPFGHVGDGNLHFNVSQPIGTDAQVFMDMYPQAADVIYQLVRKYNGSIAAEHGVGVMKKGAVMQTKSEVEVEHWRKLRAVFDPNHILNPRVLF